MAEFKTLMDVFKLLDKSNCRQCLKKTCMAFAADVFTGKSALSECPNIPQSVLEQYDSVESSFKDRDESFFAMVDQFKDQISSLDLASAAPRTGGVLSHDRLSIRCLGKEVIVDMSGKITTDLHFIPWLIVPVYHYIINARDTELSGNWLPYRELPGGRDRFRLFNQRCEKPLKNLADNHTDLFEILIELFNGKKVENHYESDISLVLHPLPHVPVLICYWKPDEGLESELNLFFDAKSEEKLPIDALYTLMAGLVVMFEKIALKHG